MCHLCNDSKFTLMYKQVTGLVVLAHHIGVTGLPPLDWFVAIAYVPVRT